MAKYPTSPMHKMSERMLGEKFLVVYIFGHDFFSYQKGSYEWLGFTPKLENHTNSSS